jgi:hypothetical protein
MIKDVCHPEADNKQSEIKSMCQRNMIETPAVYCTYRWFNRVHPCHYLPHVSKGDLNVVTKSEFMVYI